MKKLALIGVLVLVSPAFATITFDEVPPNTDLDGLTIDDVRFDYVPNPATPDASVFARDYPVNGGNFGATDNYVAAGPGDPNAELRLYFDGRLEYFRFAMSTIPFSNGRVFADVTLYDKAGVAMDTQSFETDTQVRLLNGLPLLWYGDNLQLNLSSQPRPVRSIGMSLTGTSTWLMDNIGFTTVPSPGAGGILLLGAGSLVTGRRRR